MSESPAVESVGFSIVYRSLADLAEDHKGHVSQGRMVIAWTEAIPAVGTPTELRIEVPGGAAFELSGAVSRVASGRGFAVDLAPSSRAAVGQIEQLVASHAFQQALRVESPSTRNTRKVSARARGVSGGAAPRSVPADGLGTRIPGAVTASARPPPSSFSAPPPPSVEARIPAATTASGRPPPAPAGAPAPALPPAAAAARPPGMALEPPPKPEGMARIPGAITGSQSLRAPSPQAMQAMMPAARPAASAPVSGPPSAVMPLGTPLPGSAGTSPAGASTPPRPAAGVPGIPSAATVSARGPGASPAVDDLSLDDDDEDSDAVDRYDDYDDDELYGEEDPEIAATTASDEDDAQPPTNFRTPGPGEKYVVYIYKIKTVLDMVDMIPEFRTSAKLLVASANDRSKEGDLAQLRIILPGRNIFSLWALVGRVRSTDVVLHVNPDSTAFAKALAFPKSVLGARRMATEKPHDRGPSEVIRLEEERSRDDEKDMPVRRRISRMSMEDKINMALSGSREERMALAMDGNKAIHHYLLKNARISLDEIAFIARLPTMNPDVLGKIAENPSYTQNLSVVKNLVYNPKTPVPLAIKLLDRLPRSEVLSLSKRMSMNQRLVQAAKKKIEGPSR